VSKYGIKFIIYNHDENKKLQHLNTIGDGENIHSLLMINGVEENSENNSNNNSSNNSTNIITHVMCIKNIQKYSKLHICPKCGYILPATDHGSYNRDRYPEL
jgi:hypothetical protein